jgi:hypothetical protein
MLPLTAVHLTPYTTIHALPLGNKPAMPSNLLVMPVAIALRYGWTLASLHQAVLCIALVLALRSQSSMRTELLIVPGTIAFGPHWSRASGCLAQLSHNILLCGEQNAPPMKRPWIEHADYIFGRVPYVPYTPPTPSCLLPRWRWKSA